ncbi:MAG: hypothetical protein MJA29_07845, partial [Candidatus Omnitrophica bacterium]|nr:hypothetical protein [Candidatus Omnitrophota bacterium]
VEKAGAASEGPQPYEYEDISYVVDEANQKLRMTVRTQSYGLPDVLSAASEMRRSGWEVEVDARTTRIQTIIKLMDDDVVDMVACFHERLNTVGSSVSDPEASEENDEELSANSKNESRAAQKVEVDVHPQIFPLSTIQLAALLVSDRLHIKIEGNPAQSLRVNLKPKSLDSGINAEIIFYEALIQASLDEYKLAYYEPIRSYFLKLALSFDGVLENAPLSSFFRRQKRAAQKLNYRISVNSSEMLMSVSNNESHLVQLFGVARLLRSKGAFIFEPEGTDRVRVKIQPKANIQIEALKKDLNRALQRSHIFF